MDFHLERGLQLLRYLWNWTTHDPVAFYTSVLAIATCVLVGATIMLWRSTNKLWKSGERSFTILERPYVSIDARTNSELPKNFIEVKITNHGRSIAFTTGVLQADFFIQDSPPPQFKPNRREMGVQWVIPPYDKGISLKLPIKKTDEELAEVENSKTKLFFLATISYRDGAGKWHDTGICHVYDPPTKGFSWAGGPEHNFMT